jgi:serine/threonine-protein kinase
MRPEYTHQPDIVRRFFNEARATTAIRHPGIVEVYDFGYTDDAHAYIVMELLHGVTLADRLLCGRVPSGDALLLVRRIASALSAAHGCGVVHRDLKPDNIFLVPDPEGGTVDQLKLLDFGIAKLADTGDPALTQTGLVIGTPLYMSPEQCRGAGACDHRSDLYSLGCVLFEMVAGRPPFTAEGTGEILAAHLMTTAPDVRQVDPSVPAAVANLIAHLLVKDPTARPGSAADVVSTCDRLLAVGTNAGTIAMSVPAPTPRPGGRSLIAGGIAIAAIAAIAGIAALAAVLMRGAGEQRRAPTPAAMDASRAAVATPVPLDAGGVATVTAVTDAAIAIDAGVMPTAPLRVPAPRRSRPHHADAQVAPPVVVDDVNTPVPVDDINTPVP